MRLAIERLLVALTCGLVVWLYGWFSSPQESLSHRFGGKNDYYNLLLRGFEKGHLWMDAEPDPALLASPNPYSPATRQGVYLHDATLFRGRYYLYFGPTPVLTLYGPFHALTGWYLRDAQAVPIFLSAGFLAGVMLLLGLRRRHAPGVGTVTLLAGIVAWGCMPMLFMLARRPTFYEVTIAAAFACFVLALLCLFKAAASTYGRTWLALASLAYGLAIAARPTYLFGAIALFVPVALAWRRRTRAETLAFAAVAAIPLGLVIAGMLLYNFERFGSFLDFGRAYQLTYRDELKLPHFGVTFIPENLYLYLFAPAERGRYFPFFYPIQFSHGPSGYFGIEDPYGLCANVPFLLFVPGVALAFRRNGPREMVLSILAAFAGIMPVLFSFFSATSRYMVDFAPALALLAVIGFWEVSFATRGWGRRAIACVAAVTWVWSVAFNVFAAIGHVQMLATEAPRLYESMARVSDTPRHLWDEASGRAYGPVELTLTFPAFTTQRTEPLVASGQANQTDYVYVRYADARHIELGFEHMYVSRVVSPPLEIDYAKPHTVRIAMGSLYPPPYDRYFDSMAPGEKARRLETVRIELDGHEVAAMLAEPFPLTFPSPIVGGSTLQAQAFGERFTGEIQSQRVVDADTIVRSPKRSLGAYVLTLTFPSPATNQNVPILSTGVSGKADVLSAHFVDANHLQFRLDRWGLGFYEGPIVGYRPGEKQTVSVSFGSFFPLGARPPTVNLRPWEAAGRCLHVYVDGIEAMNVATEFYPTTEETTYVGRNPMGASTCGSAFTGQLYRWERSLSGLPFLEDAAPSAR